MYYKNANLPWMYNLYVFESEFSYGSCPSPVGGIMPDTCWPDTLAANLVYMVYMVYAGTDTCRSSYMYIMRIDILLFGS